MRTAHAKLLAKAGITQGELARRCGMKVDSIILDKNLAIGGVQPRYAPTLERLDTLASSERGNAISAVTVTFSGGGATRQATGLVLVNAAGAIADVIVTDAGAGYTSQPTATLGNVGGGSGAVLEQEAHDAAVAERQARATAAQGRATGSTGRGAAKEPGSAIDRWKELAEIARKDLTTGSDISTKLPSEEQVTGKVKAMLRQVIESGTYSQADIGLARALGVPTTVVTDRIEPARSVGPGDAPGSPELGASATPAPSAPVGGQPWQDMSRRPFARAQALAYGVERRTVGRGMKLLEKANRDAAEFVDDLDAFVRGDADLKVIDTIEKRWTDAGLDQAKGRELRIEAIRWMKAGDFPGMKDAKGLRRFTEMYGTRIRAMAQEQAARLSGIGGGLVSDFRQAQEALAARESDPDLPAMEEFLRRYRRWAEHLILYLTDSGVYSAEQAQQMLESDQWTDPDTGETMDVYIDMHRIFERDGSSIMPGRRFTGSTRTIRNPLANLMEATLNAIASGDRNRAMLALADAFRNRDEAGAVLDDVRDARLGDFGRQVSEEVVQEARRSGQMTVNGRIPYLIKNNGVKEYWTFDPWIEASMEAARRQGSDGNLLLRVWSATLRFTRAMIVSFPSFMVRNLVRDIQSRMVASEAGGWTDLMTAGIRDIIRGRRSVQTEDGMERVDEMRHVSGASYAGYQDGREQVEFRLARHLDALMRPGPLGKAARVMSPLTLRRAFDAVNEWAESLNRNAEWVSAFQKAKTEGMDDFDAELIAGDKARGLIDFAEAGIYGRQLNHVILFINPAIQGINRFFRTWALVAKHAKAGTDMPDKMWRLLSQRAVVAAAAMMASAVAMRLLMDDDDEEKWQQQNPSTRDFHWFVPIDGFPDYAMPRPYDFGLLAAGAERIADAVMMARRGDQAGVARAFEGYGHSAMAALFPVNDVASLMGGLAPVIEVAANYDFFRGRTIVPAWDVGADLALRDTDRASPLGKTLQSVFKADARYIDHLIDGLGGNWGRAATSVGKPADWWLGTTTGLFKDDPAGAARDVQWVYDEAARRKLGRGETVREMNRRLREVRAAETIADREAKARSARKFATAVRAAWENTPLVVP